METKHWLLMFAVSAFVVSGIGFIIAGFNTQYDNSANTTWITETFSSTEAAQIYNQTESNALGVGQVDEDVSYYSFSKKIWQGIKGLAATPKILYNMLNASLTYFGLSWAVAKIMLIVGIIFLFSLIYFFWRGVW